MRTSIYSFLDETQKKVLCVAADLLFFDEGHDLTVW